LRARGVCLSWSSGLGLLGYGLYGLVLPKLGLTLTVYAALGFGALLHYTRAPMAHHSAMMNVTIWTEATAGTRLLANRVMLGARQANVSPRRSSDIVMRPLNFTSGRAACCGSPPC
jgi:hypothetical protein